MRVVITGGSGLIGSALARELGAAGADVVILSRDPGRLTALPAGVRAVRWDGRSAAGWVSELDLFAAPAVPAAAAAAAPAPAAGGVAAAPVPAEAKGGPLAGGDRVAIVHLAGENIATGRWSEQRKRRIRDSRLLSGEAVVAAIRQAPRPPRVLLQMSGVGYYGRCGDEAVNEDHPPGDDFLARLAVDWERSTAAVEALGVRRVVLRTAMVLAPRGGALPQLARPFRFGAGGPLGFGRTFVPWIHRADAIAALRFLLVEESASGPYNVTAPQPVTNRELARALGRALHRPSLLAVPGPALHLLLGQMAEMLLHGQRALPERLLAAGFRFRFPTLDAALADLLSRQATPLPTSP